MKLLFNLLTVILFFLHNGVSGVEADEVSVMEGDSVTLHTNVTTAQEEEIMWYFNKTQIAEITGDQSKICTDEQCKERFRDRLKVDHQTGSLTITNITITDSGEYDLQIRSSDNEKTFNVTVDGVSAAERDKMNKKMKEGESVTLHPGKRKNPNDLMRWYFNDTLIAEITGDQSKICTDDQCRERFRDRLKLDHQTGDLTITNTRTTDSGEYELQNSNSRFSIIRTFSVAVIDSGLSSAAVAGIVVVVVLLVAAVAAGVVYCPRRSHNKKTAKTCMLTHTWTKMLIEELLITGLYIIWLTISSERSSQEQQQNHSRLMNLHDLVNHT
ncbi:junctional adhesion molecule A-like, partial [Sinocyclocheilus grahami]|uniref:junctional adhesion molecule A-like n=1 Tax=Sinocyclocheilus grahami TaxID=75366 RepID=UPI0007ACE81C